MNDKDVLRARIIEQRNKCTDEYIVRNSEKIINKLLKLELFNNAKTIMCYTNFKNEVITSEFIKYCLKIEKKVCLPKVNGDILIPYYINDFEKDLVKGSFGILEPISQNKKAELEDIDLVIVPGVVFDDFKNRIGFGKGFYDKFLINLDKRCFKIGLAFSFQILKSIPSTEYDIPMDLIITEKNIIK
jgi:5-formyltetrahydrofolate cyclo-ligase